jgi:hypothetical protein
MFLQQYEEIDTGAYLGRRPFFILLGPASWGMSYRGVV